MKLNLLIILIILPLLIEAQSWQWAKQIGGPGLDNAKIGHVDQLENVYLFGGYARPYALNNYSNCYINGDTLFGSQNSFICKYDSNGNFLWLKNCVSPNGPMTIRSFVFDSLNSEFYITGIYKFQLIVDTLILSTTNSACFLAKFDQDGNCIWAKNIGEHPFSTTVGTAITVDNAGNVYLAGQTNLTVMIDTCTLTPGTFLAKFDSDGNNFWAETKVSYTNGTQTQMQFQNLEVFDDRLYVFGGIYSVSAFDTLKVDTLQATGFIGKGFGVVSFSLSSGNGLFLMCDGFPNSVNYYLGHKLMKIDKYGNIYCTIYFKDYTIIDQDTLSSFGTDQLSTCFLKYGISGDLLYQQQFNATAGLISSWIHMRDDNSFFLSGQLAGTGFFGNISINPTTPYDLFVAHLDSNGICKAVVSAGLGEGYSVFGTNNSIYLTGTFPPSLPTGNINIGNNTFTSYGWEDIVFAKHDMITGNSDEIRVSGNQLVIYANPNKGSFRIKVPEDFENDRNLVLDIFDVAGKRIKKQNFSYDHQNYTTDIFNAAPGTYNVTLSNGKRVYYGRMIVE